MQLDWEYVLYINGTQRIVCVFYNYVVEAIKVFTICVDQMIIITMSNAKIVYG